MRYPKIELIKDKLIIAAEFCVGLLLCCGGVAALCCRNVR